MRIISWNICRRPAAWTTLASDAYVDVALLQEAIPPKPDIGLNVAPDPKDRWSTAGSTRDYRTAIAWRGERFAAVARKLGCFDDTDQSVLCVSRSGTLTALDVPVTGGSVTLVSAYAFWETPNSEKDRPWIYADASVHRLISDISALCGTYHRHRLIVAGDLNILRGYGEHGDEYFRRRYQTVFDRFEALSMVCLGPEAPNGGRQAEPWPEELPRDSKNVPTFHSNRQTPATATRQLDFVFASRSLAPRIRVRALNAVDEWGPSDHCRIEILLDA